MELSEDERALLRSLPTGNFCDANGKYGAMDYGIKPICNSFRLSGPAVTANCPSRDNWTIHEAIDIAKPGCVLVVNAGGYCNAGHFGEIMALACMQKKIQGLVIDGGVRDAADLEKLGFPVFCRGVNPNGTVKASLGKVNVEIQCGGVAVRPGDMIIGDRDGVVVIPAERCKEVIEKAGKVSETEQATKREIAGGRSTLEILGLKNKAE